MKSNTRSEFPCESCVETTFTQMSGNNPNYTDMNLGIDGSILGLQENTQGHTPDCEPPTQEVSD